MFKVIVTRANTESIRGRNDHEMMFNVSIAKVKKIFWKRMFLTNVNAQVMNKTNSKE